MNARWKLTLVILLCSFLASCSRASQNAPSTAFSTFDMSSIITNGGFQSADFSDAGTTNQITGFSTQVRWGTFTASEESFPCYEVFQLVKKHFDAASRGKTGQEGWNPTSKEPTPGPVRIAIRYNSNGRHGDLNLWLFPSEDQTSVDYALHILEQPL